MVFARFEYALKKAGYFIGQGRVRPDWSGFVEKGGRADRFKERVPKRKLLKEAVKYFSEHPPKIQRVENGELDWNERSDDPLGPTSLGRATQALKDIRNNLFHGGKDPLFPEPGGRRDRELLRHGLSVLYALVDLDDKVKQAFTNG